MFKKMKTGNAESFYKGFLLVGLFLILLSFLVLPLITLFLKSFQDKTGAFVGLKQFIEYFRSPAMLQSLYNTLSVSITSTLIAVAIAFLIAYSLSYKNVPFKNGFRFIAMLPIFAPTMLLGISLIYLFGHQGLVTNYLGIDIGLYGKTGIIIAETLYCVPAAVLVLMTAFSAADNRLYEVAEVMNTKPLRKMLTITLPNIRYGLINAIFICFTYSFTDFGAPAVVGGSFNVLATDIYKQVIGQQNFNMGAVVGMVLMIPTVISFIVDRYVSIKQSSAITSRSVPYVVRKQPLSDKLSLLFCSFWSLIMLLIIAVSVYGAFVTFWPYNLNLTLAHFNFSDVGSGVAAKALENSVVVSIFVAIFGTIIAFMSAYVIEKVKILPKLKRVVYFLAISPLAIPGTVVGLSYILFFNARTFDLAFTNLKFINIFNPLYGTIYILIIVNIIHYFSVPFVTATTALKRLDNEFETVADSLRVPFYQTLFKITIPMSLGAIFEMAVYFFVNSMITVSAVIFLYSPVVRMASVAILNINDAGDTAAAAALSLLILIINIVVRLFYEVTNKKLAKTTQAWMKRS